MQTYGNSKIQIDENTNSIAVWRAPVAAAAANAGKPPSFAIAWLSIESGGNVCAVGEATATGPDGFPREVGLFQIYNPDDFRALGASASELVVGMCAIPSPGPRQHKADDGGWADGSQRNPQHQIAALTEAQIARNVELGIALIAYKEKQIAPWLAAAKAAWSTTSPDYWAAVKSYHAWPPIMNHWLGAVAKHLGRAPINWQEFRSALAAIEPTANYNAALKEQTPLYRGLENAEWCGFHVAPTMVA